MKNNIDFKNFDYQTILIKKEKVDEVVENFISFGWEVVEKCQHTQYENIIEVKFVRKHFINNKDDLQFLQVNMEATLNKKGKLEKNKYSKTTIWGIIFGLLSVGFLLCSIFSFIKLAKMEAILFGVVFAVLFVVCAISMGFLLKNLYKKEKEYFAEQIKIYDEYISECCTKAKKLTGDDYGKQGKNC